MKEKVGKISSKNAVDIIVCVLIFQLPFLYTDRFGAIYLLSVVALLYIKYSNWKESKTCFEPAIADKIWLILGLCFYILIFLLTLWGKADSGLTVYGVLLLPSYLALINYGIPTLWGLLDKKEKKTFLFLEKKTLVFLLLMCIPFLVVGLGNAYYYAKNPVYSNKYLLQMIFQLAVGAAIGEELMYRGFFYSLLKRISNRYAAMFFSSLLFTAIHTNLILQMINGFEFLVLLNLVVIFFLGIVNCMLYERSSSLLIPIVFHMLFNGTLNNILYLLMNQ